METKPMQFLSNPIEAVIFDMDGLLIDSEPIHRALWKQAAFEFGYELTDALHEQLLGRGRKGALAHLRTIWGDGLPEEGLLDRLNQYEAEFFLRGPIPLKSGAPEILDFLKAHGIKYCIATGANQHHAAVRLAQAGFSPDDFIVVTSDQVARSKTYPDLFLLAAERLNTDPRLCLVCEDSSNGIMAAHAAGMRTCLIPDLQKPTAESLSVVGHVARSLPEVLELMQV